jgi:microcin C transport system substrate-binding protein
MGRRLLLSLCIAVAAVACGPAETQKQPAPTPNEAAPPPAPAATPQPAPTAQLERPPEKLWQAPVGEPAHGISMYGELRYPPDFQHFDYVNPDAPKGGTVRFGVAEATFDSLNPWIIKGNPADVSSVFDTLMVGSADEPFSEYGLLAKTVQTPADRSWVAFELRPEARWHDGQPVTADDVVWSFETLLAKGAPSFRFYYQSVAKVEKTGPLGVKFTFKPGTNRELPLILGQLPVLPKHWWATRNIEETSLEAPLGSGPYKVGKFEANRFIELERVPDYWGKDLPVNRGRNNFDVQRYDYFRDATVALEAFKGGNYDFRFEQSAKDWATAYDVPEVRDGRIVKQEAPHQRPVGMQGFVMNLRRPLFADRRVREALDLAFDFEWANKTLFYGQYKRTQSYFENSELASHGLPSADELAVLEPLRDKLPPEVFDREYVSPKTDGSGDNRENLRKAAELLQQAGWTAQNGKLVKDGKPFAFEFLVNSPLYERIALPYAKTLEKLGITATVRTVDASQYRRRTDSFDYDMILNSFGESDSPGNEQREYWGSEAAGREGSRNAIGLKDPAIDALVDLLIASPDRQTLVTRTRALDRALLWGRYVVPNWFIGADRIAYWNKFGRPDVIPKNGVLAQLDAWWIDAAKAARLQRR